MQMQMHDYRKASLPKVTWNLNGGKAERAEKAEKADTPRY